MNFTERTELIIGKENLSRLSGAAVAVFGTGGVGSYTVEALARAGIGTLILVDHDIVSESNINRQIIALHSTIGRKKIDVIKERCLDINPALSVFTYDRFILPENCADFFSTLPVVPDFVCDCIDTVSGKLSLIEYCKSHAIRIISCMGTGNKLDPSRFRICDISKTSVCPLCRVMRRELKSRGIFNVPVLYSDEIPVETEKRDTIGSISYVPSSAGLLIAGYVIRNLMI